MKHTKNKYTLPDGTLATFSRSKMSNIVFQAANAKDKKISKQAFLEELADRTGNSFSAIKHWMSGHNAPSDLEKLQLVADYLKVELSDLLDTEEETIMTETTMPIKAVDFSTTKNTIRDIYIRMCDYIESFRAASAHGTDENLLTSVFPAMYRAIIYARLDLPKALFDQLASFAVNYLQQMPCFDEYQSAVMDGGCFLNELDTEDKYWGAFTADYECLPCTPWFNDLYISIDSDTEDCALFQTAVKNQFKADSEGELWGIHNEMIINTAYARLEAILKEYMV